MKGPGEDVGRLERVVGGLRRRRPLWLVTFDVLALAGGYVLGTVLRYGGLPDRATFVWVAVIGGTAVLAHVLAGQVFGFHRGRVAVGSGEEAGMLLGSAVVGAICAELVDIADRGEVHVGRTVPLAAAFVALCAMVVVRNAWRWFAVLGDAPHAPGAKQTLIVGAGEAARQLIKSMRHADSPYVPVALLDDDPWKRHRHIQGVAVQGTTSDLVAVAKRENAEVIVVAIPSATGEVLKKLQHLGAEADLPVKVVPSVAEMLNKPLGIRDIRDINLADILGRKPIETDIESIAHILKGKRVLVTGAGGSIGSELCRQIFRWDPAALFMLDRDESALHAVQLSIHGHGLLDTDDMVLANIRDPQALHEVFQKHRPQVVFHVAALKHLPMLEQYPAEAIKTNVLGTINVLEAAVAADVELFVNISTDKAADPTSVLGLSKRVAERVTADVARTARGTYVSVRFGNVLGSRGSVLIAWAAQIAQGGPITVTHPNVTRYFMTVAEACQLVLQAGAIGRDGEVLILDMGEPIKLDDVAKQLIAQSGKDIKIVYTGLRPGEKMDEILIADHESDERPFHELVTHVQGDAIARQSVVAAGVPAGGEAARALLLGWSEQLAVNTAEAVGRGHSLRVV